jgi:hypothetical protein
MADVGVEGLAGESPLPADPNGLDPSLSDKSLYGPLRDLEVAGDVLDVKEGVCIFRVRVPVEFIEEPIENSVGDGTGQARRHAVV